MLVLLLVVLSVVLVAVIAVLVKGNESLKAQHCEYVVAVNTVYDNHSNVIIGLQGEIEALLAKRADDQAVISSKDLHIAGLVKELKLAAEKVVVLEKLAAEKATILEKLAAEAKVELEKATASEFALKAKLDNTVTNYKKLEAYSVSCVKKSNNKKFDNCLFEDDYIMEVEKELGINWFK